jgi:tRNA 2-thiouridine synthesizing protein A
VTDDDRDNAAPAGIVQGDVEPLVVDARGHRCPVPTLRLRRALERAEPGQVVRLLADDPLAKIDVPHFVRAEGFELRAHSERDGVLSFDVTRR